MINSVVSLLDLKGAAKFADESGLIPCQRHQEAIKAIVRDNLGEETKWIADELIQRCRQLFYDDEKTTIKRNPATGELEKIYKPYRLRSAYEIGGSIKPLHLLIDAYKAEARDYNDLKKKIKHCPDRVKFLQACKKIFPNADAYHLGQVATSIRLFIQNIWHNIDPDLCKKTSTILYLYSPLGGAGKGTFMSQLQHFCKTYEIPFDTRVNLKTKWIGSEFSRNLITFSSEFFPTKSNEEEAIVKINNIVDNDYYEAEIKNQQPVTLKSICSCVVGSNRLPYDRNDRRYGMVIYNNFVLAKKKFSAEQQEFLNCSFSAEDWDRVFLDLFRTCPFDYQFSNLGDAEERGSFWETVEDTITDLRDAKSVDRQMFLESCNGMTVNQFAKAAYNHLHPTSKSAFELKLYKKDWKEIMTYLFSAGLVIPSARIHNSAIYSEYNWLDVIYGINLGDDLLKSSGIPKEVNDEADPLKRTSIAWDFLIDRESKKPQLPEECAPKLDSDLIIDGVVADKELVIADLIKKGVLFCTNLYDDPSTAYDEKKEFMILAEHKDEYKKNYTAEFEKTGIASPLSRKSKDLRPIAFLYESDTLSKKEQKQLINSCLSDFRENVLSVTDSGNKSYHSVVWIDEQDRDMVRSDPKFYWDAVKTRIFGNDAEMDEACATNGRLTRLQYGTRSTGEKQTCLFYNPDVKGIDLSMYREDYECKLRQRRYEDAVAARQRFLLERAMAKNENGGDVDEGEVDKVVGCLEAKSVACKTESIVVNDPSKETTPTEIPPSEVSPDETPLKVVKATKAKKPKSRTYQDDILTQLGRMVNSSQNPSGLLAFNILATKYADSGSNMVGAIGYMEYLCEFKGEKFRPLLDELRSICHTQHPSNIK